MACIYRIIKDQLIDRRPIDDWPLMFMPTGNWGGQITECELLKMIDTCVFRLNKQHNFQFHYSYSIDSRVNMAS